MYDPKADKNPEVKRAKLGNVDSMAKTDFLSER